MKKHNTAACVLLVLAFLLPCAGCLQGVSLDEYGYVLTIGVDQGEQKKFNISFLLQRRGILRKRRQGRERRSLPQRGTTCSMR